MEPALTGIAAIAAVIAVALILRASSRGSAVPRDQLSGRAPESPPWPESEEISADEPAAAEVVGGAPDDEEEDEAGVPRIAAVTSDGAMFVPAGNSVEIVPTTDLADLKEKAAERVARGSRPADVLGPGDLIAARVVAGGANDDPWRLEALGRDHDYLAWGFESEESARLALDMLGQGVVKPPAHPDGEAVAFGPADFETARRVWQETFEELADTPEGPIDPEDAR